MISNWSKFNESSGEGFTQKRTSSLTYDKSVEFNQMDLDKVKNLLSPWGVNINWSSSHCINFWIPYKDVKSTRKYIKIEAYQDEWFLLRDYPFYYECDQIDGVINCLKTLLPKI